MNATSPPSSRLGSPVVKKAGFDLPSTSAASTSSRPWGSFSGPVSASVGRSTAGMTEEAKRLRKIRLYGYSPALRDEEEDGYFKGKGGKENKKEVIPALDEKPEDDNAETITPSPSSTTLTDSTNVIPFPSSDSESGGFCCVLAGVRT